MSRAKKENITIRSAKLSEVPLITRFAVKVLRQHAGYHPLLSLVNDMPRRITPYVKRCIHSSRARVLVAERDGKIVAFALGKLDRQPDVFTYRDLGHSAFNYVVPSARRQGVGTRLLQELEAWYARKGASYADMYVSPKNNAGMKAWTKQGYTPVSYRLQKKMATKRKK